MHRTWHTLPSGEPLEMRGSHLYDVTATADDGQTAHAVIAADTERLAQTRLMAIQRTMRLRGQLVTFAVTEKSTVTS